MGGTSLNSLFNTIATQMTGAVGISLATIIFIFMAVGVASHTQRMRDLGITIFGIICWFGGGWLIQTITSA